MDREQEIVAQWLAVVAREGTESAIRRLVRIVIELDPIVTTVDDLDADRWGPETRRIGEAIYRNTPSETGNKPSWDDLDEHAREPWYVNAANLGVVFPDQYPDIAAENRARTSGGE